MLAYYIPQYRVYAGFFVMKAFDVLPRQHMYQFSIVYSLPWDYLSRYSIRDRCVNMKRDGSEIRVLQHDITWHRFVESRRDLCVYFDLKFAHSLCALCFFLG